MINAESLKKVATLLRSQEQEKVALSSKVETLSKEATISRTVLNMIKEGLLDTDEIDVKIAEFSSNPDLLSKTATYFDRSVKTAGKLDASTLASNNSAEESFQMALMG